MNKRIIIIFSLCLFLLSIIFVQDTYAAGGSAIPTEVDFATQSGITVLNSDSGVGYIYKEIELTSTSNVRQSDLIIRNDLFTQIKAGDNINFGYTIRIGKLGTGDILNPSLSMPVAGCPGTYPGSNFNVISCSITDISSQSIEYSGQRLTFNYYRVEFKAKALSDNNNRGIRFNGIFLNYMAFDTTGYNLYVEIYTDALNWSSENEYSDITDQLQQQQNQHEQENQQQQEAVDSVTTDSNAAQDEVNSGTTNLLGAITKFIGSITSATATNCVITLSYGSYFSQPVDLCSINPPPILTTLLSIPVALFVFKLSKNVLMKIINLFRSFQG